MSESQKSFASKWAPLALSLVANALLLAVAYGKNEVRLTVMEDRIAAVSREKLVSYLVTRAEYEQRVKIRDKEMSDNREDHALIMAKLDRIMEKLAR